MKKSVLFLAACGLLTWVMTACEPKEEPIPDSFPKKNLIEEFTGQGCGYCPYGMDCVHDFIKNDPNWIVVLHHYGYQADHFSVAGSKKITNKLRVDGAPSITVNRGETSYINDNNKKQNDVVFHPAYLETTDKSQFEKNTYASVVIENKYDADMGMVQIHVSGAICKTDYPALKLTVLIKESGMIDTQQDYLGSYEGWKEFRHANAVREFVTEPMGDELTIDENRRYSVYYNVYLDDKWVPENCAVVAFLSEDFKPVVQAEWAPVVAGSKGGSDILHGGITPVPVPDYYPEPGADVSPKTYSGADADTVSIASAYYADYEGFRLWQIQAYDRNNAVTVNKTTCVPFANLYLFTSLSDSNIPVGTYEFGSTPEPGKAYAGYRDDEHMEIDGSMFYYVSKSYLQQGYLVPEAQWLIADGAIEITASGWVLTGHARNGSEIRLVGSTPIKKGIRSALPKKGQQPNTVAKILED